MPVVWKTKALGELLRIQNGYAFDSDKFSETVGMPLVRIRDLKKGVGTVVRFNGKYDKQYVVRAGDLLIGMDGEFRCYTWGGQDSLLNQRVCRLTDFSNEVEPEFVGYGINSHLKRIEDVTPFVTVKHLSSKSIGGIQFSYPDRAEQRRIVSRIKECMERVAEIEILRKQASREADGVEYACFHDALLDGINHRRWKVGVLGDVTKSFRYGTSAKPHSQADCVPVLRMANIQRGYLDFSDLKYIELSNSELDRYRLKCGDVLINRTNSLELVGKAATFKKTEGAWVYASYLVRADIDTSLASPEFVTAVINSRVGRDYVLRTARRAIGMVNLNAKEMARFPLPLPTLKEQAEITDLLDRARPLAEELRSTMAEPELQFIRQSVLRRAFAGEL